MVITIVVGLTLGGFALASSSDSDGKGTHARDPSAGRAGTPTPEEEARMARLTRLAFKQGALTVALDSSGSPTALFPAETPGRPIDGLNVTTSRYSTAQFDAAKKRVKEVNFTQGYSFAMSYDVDTGQLTVATEAPASDVDVLRREFGDLLSIVPDTGVFLLEGTPTPHHIRDHHAGSSTPGQAVSGEAVIPPR